MNKKLITLTIFTIILSLFTGCFNSANPKDQKKNLELDGAPSWVLNPVYKNAIALSVHSTLRSTNSFDITKKEAYKNASNKLNNILERKIIASIKPLVPKDDTIDIVKISKEITKHTLLRAKVIKLFQSKTGTIYILYTLEFSVIANEIDHYLRALNNIPFYQNFLMAKGDGSLEIKLQNN
jgi:hypothetical protein